MERLSVHPCNSKRRESIKVQMQTALFRLLSIFDIKKRYAVCGIIYPRDRLGKGQCVNLANSNQNLETNHINHTPQTHTLELHTLEFLTHTELEHTKFGTCTSLSGKLTKYTEEYEQHTYT